ncbi:hypothetical protein G9C85_09320 [Halorubellus sp. JP-L1]|uniref:hypothetical protein n=1 Tax=Halorubellus sp. JP-L1 TaxID=2715753 RepID=UPI00140C8FBA|nr:hypothetical protein [Halorubellus sp. JP-L1]NHN41828.1 hypothetical protein [Halorubellus sp. JP-L1]
MSKHGRDALIEDVHQELVTYLQAGTISERAVTQSLDFTGLDIAEFRRLKRIHFCLSADVREFVSKLQERLRRVKTANQRTREITRGEVRGGIDWQATTRARYQDGAGDRTRFACKTPYTEYDIPENLVLKQLLSTIHATVTDDIAGITQSWRHDYWPGERINTFDRLYARNVHLNRIRDADDITITPRMLTTARSSRHGLYREAHDLYRQLQRLLDGDYGDPDVAQVLSETLVAPNRVPRLFELYCVFRLLRALNASAFTLQPIDRQENTIAELSTDTYHLDVYHDRTGSLSFHVPLSQIDGVEADYVKRYRHAKEHTHELHEEFLQQTPRQSLFNGRPDIVIECYPDTTRETPTAVLLSEIKYSNRQQTFATGLDQLRQYMEFAQDNQSDTRQYLSDTDTEVSGLLITDGVETETQTAGKGAITHLTAEALEDHSIADRVPFDILALGG